MQTAELTSSVRKAIVSSTGAPALGAMYSWEGMAVTPGA